MLTIGSFFVNRVREKCGS